jgi:hypothetical protein
MATPQITTDFVIIDDADALTNWGTIVGGKAILEPDVKVQGSNAVGTEAKATGIKGVTYDMGAGGTDMRNTFLMIWINVIGKAFVSTRAAGGVFVRLEDTSGNTGDWYVGGSDTAWVGQGYKLLVIDVNRAFDAQSASVDKSNIRYVGAAGDWQVAVSKSTAIALDIMRYGTRFEITGGSGIDPISFQDVIDKDQSDDTYYGIITRDKNGNLEFAGKIFIGDPSGARGLETVFRDSEDVVTFADNPVESGYYGIEISQVAGSPTDIEFGEVVSSGNNAIGSKGLTIISDETEWTHEPSFVVNNVNNIGLYSLQTRNFANVYIGASGNPLAGSNVFIVDCNFNDVDRLIKNIDSTSGSPLLLRNKISFAKDTQASIDLIDTEDILRNEFDIIQGRGFIHTPPGTDDFIITEYNFDQFLKPYVSVGLNETWDIINPTWTIYPSGQDELEFLNPSGNVVNEKYDFNFTVKTPAGVAISGAHTWVGETSPSVLLPSGNRQDTDANGDATSRYLQNEYTDLLASGLNTNPRDDTFAKVYSYTKSPFTTSLGTINSAQNLNVTLLTDNNISETDQDTAISDGSGIIVTRDQATPFAIIAYTAGNGGTITDGDVIAGASSNASGIFREQAQGNTTAGKIFLEDVDGTFSAGEELDIIAGAGTWDDADYTSGSQQEFTWGIDAQSKSLQTTYDYLSAKISEGDSTIDSIFADAILWGEDENSLLVQAVGGDTYKTERTVRLLEGGYIYNRGAGNISYMTADDGTTFTPPTTYTLTLTDLKSNSEVRIYEDISGDPGNELDGIENSGTTFQYTYTYGGSDINVIVVIFHLSWLAVRLFLTLSNADRSIPIQQFTDRVYENP